MKKRNKLVSLLLVTVMATGLLMGCGGGDTSKDKTPAGDGGTATNEGGQETTGDEATGDEAGGEKTKLTIWTYTSATADKGYQAIVDAYMKENPQVEIEFSSFTSDTYESKLTSALSSGKGPDLFGTYG